jgi:hypothetical protein
MNQHTPELRKIETPAVGGPLDGDSIMREPDDHRLYVVVDQWAYGYELDGGRLVFTGERWLDDATIARELEDFEPGFRELAQLWSP